MYFQFYVVFKLFDAPSFRVTFEVISVLNFLRKNPYIRDIVNILTLFLYKIFIEMLNILENFFLFCGHILLVIINVKEKVALKSLKFCHS